MAKVIVFFSMCGYTTIDLPDNYEMDDVDDAYILAENDINHHGYEYLTGTISFDDYGVEE